MQDGDGHDDEVGKELEFIVGGFAASEATANIE